VNTRKYRVKKRLGVWWAWRPGDWFPFDFGYDIKKLYRMVHVDIILRRIPK
jgi:hypothetical protein